MDRAHLGDLEQSSSLRRAQISVELQCPVHTIEPTGFRRALRAINCMNPGMLEPDGHFLQRPPFSSRVQRNRHRRSTTQRSQQEIIGSWTSIRAAVRKGFVCHETMPTRRNLLRESAPGPANGDFRLVRRVVDRHFRDLHVVRGISRTLTSSASSTVMVSHTSSRPASWAAIASRSPSLAFSGSSRSADCSSRCFGPHPLLERLRRAPQNSDPT